MVTGDNACVYSTAKNIFNEVEAKRIFIQERLERFVYMHDNTEA